MTREPHSLSEYEKALTKAKQKYAEYLRNYSHYNKMVDESIYLSSRCEFEFKRNHCTDVMETLSYIFGLKVLNENNQETNLFS